MKTGWWQINFEITLDGKRVDFEDLDDYSREQIVECIKDGCVQGEVVEDDDDYEN